MDKYLSSYMMSYWVRPLHKITSNNTENIIIVDEMNIVSTTMLKKIHVVCLPLLQKSLQHTFDKEFKKKTLVNIKTYI